MRGLQSTTFLTKIVNMKVLLWIFFSAPLFISCKTKVDSVKIDPAAESINLLEADKAFSALSEAKGMKAAFIEYLDDSSGVLLRPHEMPLVGGDAIDWIIRQEDNNHILTWTPRHAEVAIGGDVGFTYGIYNIKQKDSDVSYLGTYLRIWKKRADGKWKLLQDTNNEGVQ